MGILLYVYVSAFNGFSFWTQQSLKALSFENKSNIINRKVHQYNFFLNILNNSTKKSNFFKKEDGLGIFFNDVVLQQCCVNVGCNFFSDEKKKFFIFNFLVLFFKKNYFNDYFKRILDTGESVSIGLFAIIQMITCALTSNSFKGGNMFFISFNKIFDFFLFKNFLFTKKQKFLKNFFNVVRDFTLITVPADQSLLLPNQIKKYNTSSFKQTKDLVSDKNGMQCLLLLNSFFTKNKKFFFLRNNEIYNKSRYSRNKQTYKTGVFWCIWLTVLTVIGLYFYFYIFLIKFTYFWVLFYVFALMCFFYYFRSKVEKHFFF